MVAAIFILDSLMGHEEHYFEGENATDIMEQFDQIQDLECLSRMAKSHGSSKDKIEIKKLDCIIKKYYSGELIIDDLLGFSLDISIGKISVKAIAHNEKEILMLKG